MPFCVPPAHPEASQEVPAVGVKIENLVKNFGKLEVLKDVSFEVKSGEIFVLMGPSGSGKSVLLRHIVALERPTSGRVTIDGHDAALAETREHVKIGLVFQAGALFNSLSVYDNLALYLREHRIGTEAEIKAKVMHALKILSLENTGRKYPSDLSGRALEKHCPRCARSLVMEPQLLLYDEPTSELDPVMSATISEIIGSLKDQYRVTSIVVSHDRDLALNIADRIGVLMGGKLVTVGTPAELKASSDPRIVDFLHPKFDLHNPRFKKLEN